MNTEDLWRGQFGNDYTERNEGKVRNNIEFFARALTRVDDIQSLIEFGAGTGQNLKAIHYMRPSLDMTAIEINESAAKKIEHAEVINKSVFEESQFIAPRCDLVLSKGFLIHVPPDMLQMVYQRMLILARRYILIAEYYNPTPVEVEYRGKEGRMWKRDFASDLMQLDPKLKLIDYGFVYHKDKWPQDDITWMLMEKK